MSLGLILLIAALLSFCAVAVGMPSRLNLMGVGLALVVIYFLVSAP